MGIICACCKRQPRLLLIDPSEDLDFDIQAEDIKRGTNYFSYKNRIGAGGFGEVYRTETLSYGILAVKRMKEQLLTVNDLLECQNIIQYRHTNLVCLFSALMVDNHFCMVMEYVANGSLRSKLKAKDENLDYSVRLQICRGIAEGINYLHTAFMTYLVHRDIKSDNILLTEDYTPKICDFGLAKILSARIDHGNSAIFTETICGTEPYLPPESFQGIVSRRFDVYSYGVVLLEIISGKPATFSDLEGCRFLANYFLHCYNHDKSTFPIAETAPWPNNIKKKLMKLAKNCLKRNYRDRPQMDKVTTKLAKINLMQDNSPDSKLTRFFSRI